MRSIWSSLRDASDPTRKSAMIPEENLAEENLAEVTLEGIQVRTLSSS